jgi:hypothetical protein
VFSHSTYSPSGVVDTHDSVVSAMPGISVGNRYPKTLSVLLSYFTECFQMIQNEVITRRVSETEKYRMARLLNQRNVFHFAFWPKSFYRNCCVRRSNPLVRPKFGLFVEYVVNVPRLEQKTFG